MYLAHLGRHHRAIPLLAMCAWIPGIAVRANPAITGMMVQYQQAVVGTNGDPINDSDGLDTLADEHSTIFPELDGHGSYTGTYTFDVATRTNANVTSSGLVTLPGTVNQNYQWTLATSPAPSQTFLSPVLHDAALPDPTFDLNYAAPGSVLRDPTNSGNPLMVYSATNRSIGLASGASTLMNGAYNTVGIATSNDGVTWPTYANVSAIPPNQSGSAGPNAPNGATGASVCAGYATSGNVTTCNSAGNSAAYGRYPVLGPATSIASEMATYGSNGTGAVFPTNIGDGSPSGFVDTHSGSATTWLYVVDDYLPGNGSSSLVISRAALNGGTAPLLFQRWANGSFADPGLLTTSGAIAPASIGFLPGPATASQSCEGPNQTQTAGSISYAAATGQYLLTFACILKSAQPKTNTNGLGAWFFAVNNNLSNGAGWSQPQEISGSEEPIIPVAGGPQGTQTTCDSFAGWYPSFMSTEQPEGELGLNGYAFFLNGCRGDPTFGSGRTFDGAYFTIETSSEVPEPATMFLFTSAILSLVSVRGIRRP